MLHDLGKATGHEDLDCVEFFRQGAPAYGALPVCGIGLAKEVVPVKSIVHLWENCAESNWRLLKTLRESEHSAAVFKQTMDEADLGRMTKPRLAKECDLNSFRLNPRFPVEQGVKADGSIKLRMVDNMSWSCPAEGAKSEGWSKKRRRVESVNGHTVLGETIKHDHLDELMLAIKVYHEKMGVQPGLWKADIDSAFRRIPLLPDHWWACAIAFKHEGELWISEHRAAPFGASSSVHAWERVGALICTIARRALRLPVHRYVDDYFGFERPSLVKHSMECFARLVRLLLGQSAIANKKLECGPDLTILGVEVVMDASGYKCRPSREKANKCMAVMRNALVDGTLKGGCALKLAGRLSWAGQFLFHRVGRAMLRPIFDQKFSRTGALTVQLKTALGWWLWALEQDIVETRQWKMCELPPVRLLVDAAGVPAHCAAVLFVDGRCLYTDGAPAAHLMKQFQSRSDNQIMTLEILAIALGLSTFAEEVRGRKVVVFSDNTGAEAASRKGTASSWDHCQLIHEIWSHCLCNKTHIWIERVASEYNLSDLPSRPSDFVASKYIFESLDAKWRAPVIAKLYYDAKAVGAYSGIS